MIRLLGEMWVVSGSGLTHKWDAHAYLIKGRQPALIDCGSTLGYPALKQSLKSFGYEPRDITQVIATHGHWDHVSGMSLLREESDARFYIHGEDRRAVETGDDNRTAAYVYGRTFPPLQPDGELEDGQELELGNLRFTVVHTPGHSPGSICLLTEVAGIRLLVAADTLFGAYNPRLGSDLEQWSRSVDRLLDIGFDAIVIGHAQPGLIFNARRKVLDARKTFGALMDPWFQLDAAEGA